MLQEPHIVRKIAIEIGQVASRVTNAYRYGDAPYETDVTGRLLGAVVERLNGYNANGVKWCAKQMMTGRGIGAEEKITGADFMGVLNIKLKGYAVQKGFLAQAKRAEPEERISDWPRLISQAEKMLRISPASYVFIYSKKQGIRVFPAISVLGLGSHNIFDLYNRSFGGWFEEYLKCFIGDNKLTVPYIDDTIALHDIPATRLLHLRATDGWLSEAPLEPSEPIEGYQT